jgi:hypothetical protein
VQTGCLPVRRRAHLHSVLREGVEPSTSAFGGPRSDPVELPQRLPSTTPSTPSRSPGRIRTCNRPVLSRPPLPSWATGPIHLPRTPSLHRAGLEPASDRLKAGGSAVELSVRRRLSRASSRAAPHAHREGFEPPTHSLEGSCSVPLSYRRVALCGHRFLLSIMTRLGFRQCTRQDSNLQPSG